MTSWNGADIDGHPLVRYAEAQSEHAQQARTMLPPSSPWPEAVSPILRYLIASAADLLETDGLESALVWLASHAWFEGALDAIDRSTRR